MNTKTKSVIWGIVLVLIGVVYGGNALGAWDFSLFFPGWWTLFIIVPALVSMITNGIRTDNVIFLLIGVGLLLAKQDIVEWALLWKLLVPVILIVIGVRLIFAKAFNPQSVKLPESSCAESTTSVFSGDKVNFANRPYAGSEHTAIFGGFEVDLRDAIITGDVVIRATCIFGGGDIFLPPNVKFKTADGCSVFGGLSDKRLSRCEGDAPTVYLKAVCIFGGIDIK